VITRARSLAHERRIRNHGRPRAQDLEVLFFDAKSARVWD
jgi:hypothetical protein